MQTLVSPTNIKYHQLFLNTPNKFKTDKYQ